MWRALAGPAIQHRSMDPNHVTEMRLTWLTVSVTAMRFDWPRPAHSQTLLNETKCCGCEGITNSVQLPQMLYPTIYCARFPSLLRIKTMLPYLLDRITMCRIRHICELRNGLYSDPGYTCWTAGQLHRTLPYIDETQKYGQLLCLNVKHRNQYLYQFW